MDASRWVYNLTVEILQDGVIANWKKVAKRVMPELARQHPEWEKVPYELKRTSVREACKAMSNVKKFNQILAEAKRRGERTDEEFAELDFRSRKNPKQSCYIPSDSVKDEGAYPRKLGTPD